MLLPSLYGAMFAADIICLRFLLSLHFRYCIDAFAIDAADTLIDDVADAYFRYFHLRRFSPDYIFVLMRALCRRLLLALCHAYAALDAFLSRYATLFRLRAAFEFFCAQRAHAPHAVDMILMVSAARAASTPPCC